MSAISTGASIEAFKDVLVVETLDDETLVVEPRTAMVSLLDQFVRSPFAASLLLGMEPDEDFMEVEMHNPDLHGVAFRDIHFPHDVLILSISHKGNRLVSHGYTRLELGDHVTVVGSPDSLAEVQARFEV